MPPLLFIRKQIFRLKQSEMAAVAGVTQGTVSKWEAGISEPSRDDMQRIRENAIKAGIDWRDEWFFQAQERPLAEVAA